MEIGGHICKLIYLICLIGTVNNASSKNHRSALEVKQQLINEFNEVSKNIRNIETLDESGNDAKALIDIYNRYDSWEQAENYKNCEEGNEQNITSHRVQRNVDRTCDTSEYNTIGDEGNCYRAGQMLSLQLLGAKDIRSIKHPQGGDSFFCKMAGLPINKLKLAHHLTFISENEIVHIQARNNGSYFVVRENAMDVYKKYRQCCFNQNGGNAAIDRAIELIDECVEYNLFQCNCQHYDSYIQGGVMTKKTKNCLLKGLDCGAFKQDTILRQTYKFLIKTLKD